MDETPSAVLINVGQSEQSVTVTAEITKLLGRSPSFEAANAETTIVTIGNHASGDTGLNIWISGLSTAFAIGDSPAAMPRGTAIAVAIKKPKKTV